MSEANTDLLEKYRKEVALRRKYHEQLVELKGSLWFFFFTNYPCIFKLRMLSEIQESKVLSVSSIR